MPTHRAEIERLEKESADAGFWDNPQRAQTHLKQLKLHKNLVEPWNSLAGDVGDTLELAEMMAAEGEEDAASLAEFEEVASRAGVAVAKQEFQSTMS